MRHLLISVLLFAIAGAAFAQKGGGQPARATDLATLAAAVSDIADRVSRLEGNLTPATAAGTYSFIGLEVEVGQPCSGECVSDITHHATQNGVMVLNPDMSFALNVNDSSAKIRVDLLGGGTQSARLATRTILFPSMFQATGTWSISGKVITLNIAGESARTLLVAGPGLLVNALKSDDGTDHSLVLLVRQ